jgi:hypothetical protein
LDKQTLIYAAFPMAFSLVRMPACKVHKEMVVCRAASSTYSKLKRPSDGCCFEVSELGFPIEGATRFVARVCWRHIRLGGIFDHTRLVSCTERRYSTADVVRRQSATPNSHTAFQSRLKQCRTQDWCHRNRPLPRKLPSFVSPIV